MRAAREKRVARAGRPERIPELVPAFLFVSFCFHSVLRAFLYTRAMSR